MPDLLLMRSYNWDQRAKYQVKRDCRVGIFARADRGRPGLVHHVPEGVQTERFRQRFRAKFRRILLRTTNTVKATKRKSATRAKKAKRMKPPTRMVKTAATKKSS